MPSQPWRPPGFITKPTQSPNLVPGFEKVTPHGCQWVGNVPPTFSEEEMNQLFTCMQEDLLARTYDQGGQWQTGHRLPLHGL